MFPVASCTAQQAQCLHGNKWTFIAAQYLPWRFPLDLRAACHVRTKQDRAARNPYLQEGQSLAWLLTNTPNEYKQRWEQHKRRVSTSEVGHKSCQPEPYTTTITTCS